MKSYHMFHMVEVSFWPLLCSLSVSNMMLGMIFLFKSQQTYMMVFSTIMTMIISFLWWRDVVRESTFQGHHTSSVVNGLKLGMLLFIFSEVMFFFGFFWAFFNNSVNPDSSLGLTYPSFGLKSMNPMEVPLLNTLILLSSGSTVTMSHHFLLKNKDCVLSLAMTVMLGMYFTSLQLMEYMNSTFSISDSVYGSSFFVMTGFHGLHVMVGTLFLIVCLLRILQKHMTYNHHFGYEAAIWYWHFVDVVWLFLFVSIYCWGF